MVTESGAVFCSVALSHVEVERGVGTAADARRRSAQPPRGALPRRCPSRHNLPGVVALGAFCLRALSSCACSARLRAL
eukprot:15459157-Alexandrium_andersonii.AAC.1